MALNIKVGTWTKATTTAPVNDKITGLGASTKVLILWTNGETAESTFSNNFRTAVGWTVSTAGRSACQIGKDNVGTSDTSRRQATTALSILSTAASNEPSLGAEGDLTSTDATSFTFRWSTNNAAAYIIHYMALGGSDIKAETSTMSFSTATANVTVNGMAFTADAVMFLSIGDGGAWTTSADRANAVMQLGIAVSTNQRWAQGSGSEHNQNTSDTGNVGYSTACLVGLSAADVGVENYRVDYLGGHASGFTVELENPPTATVYAAWLALNNTGKFQVGSFKIATASGAQTLTGMNFTGDAALFMGHGKTSSSGAINTDNEFSFGGTDGTNQTVVWGQDDNDNSVTIVAQLSSSSRCIFLGAPTAAGSTSTRQAVAQFSSFGATTILLKNDIAGAAAYAFGFFMMQAGPVTAETFFQHSYGYIY